VSDRVVLLFLLAPLAIVTVLWWRTAKKSRWLLGGALLGFCLFWGPFAWGLLRWLEAPYFRGYPTSHGEQAIVVLAATVYPPEPERPVPLVGENTYERAFYAAWLYKHWRPLPILVSGGPEREGTPPFSETIKKVLIAENVPADAIWTEEQSQSTYENAVYSAAMLRRHGITRVLLITQGYHMRRAEAAMRKQGIEVVPGPCGFLGRSRLRASQILLPSQEAFEWSMFGVHEVVGLLWYRIRGYI
jgi:uncharacterized SAM-binding protein YcdF (DUF218 family)